MIAPVERNGTLIPTGSLFREYQNGPSDYDHADSCQVAVRKFEWAGEPFVLLRSEGAPAGGDLAAFAPVSQLLGFRSPVQMLSARS